MSLTKTLYTPVFFSTSEPPRSSRSSASANLKVPSTYLNSLSRTHIALAQIVQEVPSSRPGSPTEDADGSYPDSSTQERVSALRARVQEAWAMADGNPADGKWTFLAQLLRMSVTSGRAGRWAGTRADLKAPDAPDVGWVNALTEAEWAEWERRLGLKDKVENWKMRLETHEDLNSQIIKDSQRTGTTSKSELPEGAMTSTPVTAVQPKRTPASESIIPTNSNPLKDNSLFGFAVIKRSNTLTAAAGKKPPASRLPNENATAPSADVAGEIEQVDSKQPNRPPNDTTTAPLVDTAPEIRKIADIPEMSFLPPSFLSSQMMTSTPNAKPISSNKHKHKPEPIPFTASPVDGPTGSITFPHATKVYGRLRQDQLSTSLPAIPSTTPEAALLPLPPVPTTPTRNRNAPTNDTNKRPFSFGSGDVDDDRVVKKARTVPSLNSSPIATGSPQFNPNDRDERNSNRPLPTTPKRQNLPTLTALLASAKKGKKKPQSPKGMKLQSAGSNTNIELASDKSNFRFPSPLPNPLAPGSPLEDNDNPYMLDPYAISHSGLELDIDLSPTKSLSSLAGSDSEDEDEDDKLKHQALGINFSPSSSNPCATSTQYQNYEGHFITSPHSSPFLVENQKARASLLLGLGGGYNSQFDVAGQVDKVDKLLEKDVDYEGWLRDPSLEKEGVRVEESP